MPEMKQLMLLIYLRDDLPNTLERRYAYMQEKGICPSPEGRDGVIQLSHNATVFDLQRAHDVFAQVCAGLLSGKFPYLVFPVQQVDDWVAVGSIPKEVAENLQKLNVPMIVPRP